MSEEKKSQETKECATKGFLDEALEIAAVCWCDKDTESITMDSRLAKAFAKRLHPLMERVKQLEFSEEHAWVLIANAYGGDWDLASEASGWKAAAERWRDDYHRSLPKNKNRKSEVEK